MAGYTVRPDSGSLFPNEKKEQAKQPDYNGKILLSPELLKSLQAGDGMVYIAGWKHRTKDGRPYLSLSAQGPREKSMSTAKSSPPTGFDEDRDGIPF